MSGTSTPSELAYTKTHEWIRTEGEQATIGITDHAQAELTDIVFVDLPAPGKEVKAGQSMLVLESVKTVADVYAPADGTVESVNGDLKAHPEWINQEPYGRGWIVRLKLSSAPPAGAFLTAEQYRASLGSP